jgi:hypothetical protein
VAGTAAGAAGSMTLMRSVATNELLPENASGRLLSRAAELDSCVAGSRALMNSRRRFHIRLTLRCMGNDVMDLTSAGLRRPRLLRVCGEIGVRLRPHVRELRSAQWLLFTRPPSALEPWRRT